MCKMGDTRCADPALQLDVDVLMFEYLLHNAIKSQLSAMDQSYNNEGVKTETDGEELEATAQRLLIMFECEYYSVKFDSLIEC
jgi:hypothetical protein